MSLTPLRSHFRANLAEFPSDCRTVQEKGTGYITLVFPPCACYHAAMPRAARDSLGGYCYHVMNRGNARRTVFRKQGVYDAFFALIAGGGERIDVRWLS